MKELHRQLLAASRAYYQESREIMSNFEYDRLYDELLELEKETGTVLAGSPTQKVGYEVLSELPKEAHEAPMLSLDKTKEVPVLQEWLGSQKGLLSWKLDGLTIVLTYEGGELVKAVTRGNGEIGEVITNNARVFSNVPLRIPEYLEMPAAVRSEEYYVNMMTAWFFATALAKQWDAAIPYLEQKCLDPWTHNKTIQKARESYRITPEQKEYLKTLKRK